MSSGASRVKISTASWSAEEVGALDRVEGVALRAVVAGVAERGVDPALGGAGVAARRVELREEGDVGAGVERLDRGAHPGAAGADHEYVVRRLHAPLTLPERPAPAPQSPGTSGPAAATSGSTCSNFSKFAWNICASSRALPSYASGSRQVERGSSSAGSTPGTATGTSKPNTSSMR